MENESSDGARDWRLHVTAKLGADWVSPWTGQRVAAGTNINVVTSMDLPNGTRLTVSLPNATALFFSMAHRSYTDAREILEINNLLRRRGVPKEAELSDVDAFRYIELMLSAVVAAHTGIEAYVNEHVPEDYVHTYKGKKGNTEQLAKPDIERWLTLSEKLSDVLPAAYNISSPKQSRCWQDYLALKRVRDRIIHMKAIDRKSSLPGADTLWHTLFTLQSPYYQARKIVEYFADRIETKPTWYRRLPKE